MGQQQKALGLSKDSKKSRLIKILTYRLKKMILTFFDGNILNNLG